MTGDQGFEISPRRQKLFRELHDRGEPVFESIAYYVVMDRVAPNTFDRWVNDTWLKEFNEGREFTRLAVVEVGEKTDEIRHVTDHLRDSIALRVVGKDQTAIISDRMLQRVVDNPGIPFDRSIAYLQKVNNKLAPPQSRGTTDPGNR